MKKSKLLLLTILLLCSGFVLAQNPFWIMPNKYVDVPNGNYSTLPTVSTSQDGWHTGDVCTNASNMQLDANHNITPSLIILRKQSLGGWFGKSII